jgi:Fe2+ or Zn2+ uptake regulation protein
LTCADSLSLEDLLDALSQEGIDISSPEITLEQLIEEGFIERTTNDEFRIAEC